MLIKYVKKNGKRIGVVVATGKNAIGWSKLHKGDKWDKDMGLKIAAGRAMSYKDKKVPTEVRKDYDEMIERAKKYYK